MDVKSNPVSEDWVPLGIELKRPSHRKPNDRGKRSVAELAKTNGGPGQAIQRDGYYRPKDGTAEYLTFWTATSRGWAQVSAFAWSDESHGWSPVERTGPKPT